MGPEHDWSKAQIRAVIAAEEGQGKTRMAKAELLELKSL
jgi:hypothetical protein